MCSPALGDTLLFAGAVQDLRRFLEKDGEERAELVHFCMPQNLAAAELVAGVDRRVLLDLKDLRGTVARLRAEACDLLFDFTSWQRLTAFYSMVSGAKYTVGFSTAGQYRGRGYDLAVEHRRDRHELDNFRGLLRAFGIPAGLPPTLVVPAVAQQPLADAGEVVVFHPWASGARGWLREWPLERWVELAAQLVGDDTVFVVTGGPADAEQTGQLVAALQAAGLRSRPYVSPDGFVSLAHLLRRSRVVVSVNTGVMHLAAVLGAPTVSLNGPNHDDRWGPRGECVRGVPADDGSGGFLHLGFEFDGQPTDVMGKISVASVLRAVAEVKQCAAVRRAQLGDGAEAMLRG